MSRLRRLPIRLRLIVGFAASMAVLLVLVSAFVFSRVRIALDHRLDQDLHSKADDLVHAARRLPPAQALAALRDESREAQILNARGQVLASGPGIPRRQRLLTTAQARSASAAVVTSHSGNLLSRRGALRVLALPVHGRGGATTAVMAVRLDQRDEALRELLAQLAIGNAIALLLASALGYRFARAALDPVERYRAQAERITHGAAGVRLEVPDAPRDELTRLGDTLNSMIDALERAAERQKNFIDDASHELRTPLAALRAEIAVALRKQRTPEEYEASLERLAATTSQLTELAETLLSLGALGSEVPNLQPLPVPELISEAAARARGQLKTNGRIIQTNAPPLLVRGDPVLLARALGNLADNAVRHGRGDIAFSARPSADGSYVTLLVHDDGSIDVSFISHAADRFRQGEDSRASGGAGLGLALVDAIAVAHGGQLRICSGDAHHAQPASTARVARMPCLHPREGTTVSVFLPAHAMPSRDASTRRRGQPATR